MNWDQQNIKVYNQSAQAMSEYFSGIGSRTEDIERGIALAGNPSEPRIVEIGCGDGRDTIEIARRARSKLLCTSSLHRTRDHARLCRASRRTKPAP